MNPILEKRMVVWSGSSGGTRSMPYFIRYGTDWGGCWCPREATSFFQYLGIQVVKNDHLSSGYQAKNCYFEYGLEPIDNSLLDKATNRAFCFVLKK